MCDKSGDGFWVVVFEELKRHRFYNEVNIGFATYIDSRIYIRIWRNWQTLKTKDLVRKLV